MGGLVPGKYIVIGARPGMGKSAFSNQLIFDTLSVNRDRKIMVLYWSFEMTGEDQVSRLGSKATQRELYHLFSIDQRLSDEHFIEYTKAVSNYKSFPVYFSERPQSSGVIYSVNAQVHESQPEWQVINIVDHSRLVSKEGEMDELRLLNYLSKTLHNCNVEFKTINILISQLNRDIEKDARAKNQYKPLLSDLFGADSVGQDADAVIMLNRPYDVYGLEQSYEGFDPRGLLAAHITKNRGGELGMIPLDFDAKHFTISERNETVDLKSQPKQRKRIKIVTTDEEIF